MVSKFYRFLAEVPVQYLLNEATYQSHVRVRDRFRSGSGPVRDWFVSGSCPVRVRFVFGLVSEFVSGLCPVWIGCTFSSLPCTSLQSPLLSAAPQATTDPSPRMAAKALRVAWICCTFFS